MPVIGLIQVIAEEPEYVVIIGKTAEVSVAFRHVSVDQFPVHHLLIRDESRNITRMKRQTTETDITCFSSSLILDFR